jgi:hypothetical protein
VPVEVESFADFVSIPPWISVSAIVNVVAVFLSIKAAFVTAAETGWPFETPA